LMMKRPARALPEPTPRTHKARLGASVDTSAATAKTLCVLMIKVGRKDNIARGNYALGGLVLPIWSPRQIIMYMPEADMHAAIGDLKSHLAATK
jgi:hypothetical protein